MERKVCFISDASNEEGESFIDRVGVLHAETAQSSLTVIFKLSSLV